MRRGCVLLALAYAGVTMMEQPARTSAAPVANGEGFHIPPPAGGGAGASHGKPVVYMADSRMPSDAELAAITSIDTAPWNVLSAGACPRFLTPLKSTALLQVCARAYVCACVCVCQ